MSINHAHLRAFNAVATHGSYTRAAEVLHLSQPTLSAHVKELEERYSVKLFERRGRGVVLTDFGRSVLDITERLFRIETEVEELLISARELVTGQLRVGADSPYHIIPIMAAFQVHYPGIQLSISFGNSEQLLKSLLSSKCDIAVLLPTGRGRVSLGPRLKIKAQAKKKTGKQASKRAGIARESVLTWTNTAINRSSIQVYLRK